jgi:threonylcarbamoyladenosine tRNA methylthiotransferase MtaB
MARYYLKTYGCKVNQCDSEHLAARLESWGMRPASDPRSADLSVVNTCTVTAVSDSKCLKSLRAAKRTNPSATVVATGCLTRRDPGKVASAAAVDALIDIEEAKRWRTFLAEQKLIDRSALTALSDVYAAPSAVGPGAPRTRSFVKVQDGCDAFCSYCIVPFVRGRARSVPMELVCEEVNRSVESGAKEVVLTGIHLGVYGNDLSPGITLATLVKTLLDNTAIERLRLSSIEVNEVAEELLDLYTSSKRLQRHVHIPLQSGDDAVLHAMNRHYSAEDFRRTVRRIRDIDRDMGITTDVLVGFPTETDTAFENTVSLVEELEFSRLHVFKYSPRPGTAAAALTERVSPGCAKERSERMIELGTRLAERFAERFVGTTVEVLIESKRDPRTGWLTGFASNYLRVAIRDATDGMVNTVAQAVVEDTIGPKAVASGAAQEKQVVSVGAKPTMH